MLVIRTAKQWYHFLEQSSHAEIRVAVDKAADICEAVMVGYCVGFNCFSGLRIGTCDDLGGDPDSTGCFYACFDHADNVFAGVTPYTAILALLDGSRMAIRDVLRHFSEDDGT